MRPLRHWFRRPVHPRVRLPRTRLQDYQFPMESTAAPSLAPKTPAPSSNPPTSAQTGGLAEPVPASPPTLSTPKQQVIDLETLPSSATVGDAAQPMKPGGAPHQEDNDPVPARRTPVLHQAGRHLIHRLNPSRHRRRGLMKIYPRSPPTWADPRWRFPNGRSQTTAHAGRYFCGGTVG